MLFSKLNKILAATLSEGEGALNGIACLLIGLKIVA